MTRFAIDEPDDPDADDRLTFRCCWCGQETIDDEHYPFCSLLCSVVAECHDVQEGQ